MPEHGGEFPQPTEREQALIDAILDIDAHATPMGSEDGFVSGGYIISVGALHRALGLVGHTAKKVDHAVWLEVAHPDCDACNAVKDTALTALKRPSQGAPDA